MFNLLFMTPQRVVFEGKCKSIMLPGEEGTFELLAYHKNLISRLLKGVVVVDNDQFFAIQRGIVKLESNTAVVIVEPAAKQEMI